MQKERQRTITIEKRRFLVRYDEKGAILNILERTLCKNGLFRTKTYWNAKTYHRLHKTGKIYPQSMLRRIFAAMKDMEK